MNKIFYYIVLVDYWVIKPFWWVTKKWNDITGKNNFLLARIFLFAAMIFFIADAILFIIHSHILQGVLYFLIWSYCIWQQHTVLQNYENKFSIKKNAVIDLKEVLFLSLLRVYLLLQVAVIIFIKENYTFIMGVSFICISAYFTTCFIDGGGKSFFQKIKEKILERYLIPQGI